MPSDRAPSRPRTRSLSELSRTYLTVREPWMRLVLRIQAQVCSAIRSYLDGLGFVELLPPIIGPCTDPGIRGARQATVDFYGREYKVMSSAILYKQMMISSLGSIYFFSPNVRLEPLETAHTKRHLAEFVQVDVEKADADYYEAMNILEGMLVYVCTRIRDEADDQLGALGTELRVPVRPFRRISHREAVDLLRAKGYSLGYRTEIPWEEEEILSGMFDEPFFVYDYLKGARGFYDKEDAGRRGILRDFDLLYPQGFGEAASGAEREYQPEKVLERMRESGEDPARYGWYLEMLKEGVSPSSGFGIGVERLTRYICGLEAVWDARPYPKVAGVLSP